MSVAQEELDSIYIAIGENRIKCDDKVMARIEELQNIINPPVVVAVKSPARVGSVCGDPYCNGEQCWECAAIRGGDPADV